MNFELLNTFKDFQMDEIKFIDPNVQKVEEIFNYINDYIESNEYEIVDYLTALILTTITICQECEISKPMVLGYISNSWELNDKDSDYDPNLKKNIIKRKRE